MRRTLLAILLVFGLWGCAPNPADDQTSGTSEGRTAIFAGGCFWCLEADFEQLPGVIAAESGYTGGYLANPSYALVSLGITGHTEAVRVTYDPQRLSYAQLLDHFWRHIDPTVADRQFCDIGSQYRSGIYWQDDDEKQLAEASRDALLASGRLPRIATEIRRASTFFRAEEYHQDYYRKNPLRYAYYRYACGRDARVQQIWGDDQQALPRWSDKADNPAKELTRPGRADPSGIPPH
ncbi:MAG: peptide-methionine (S)-S-oxide reductase MsrA [Candidatus Accumulibacter sp.]|uniref:peptide-methionine (S)-S-oxide reductase MsrA n=1 Tax=Accumulibacter sp. TaxID=2053492 RepID=UPI0028799F73|nr:peptide-methionine (S)-S-oxide reductase MsrA [Accumulibacter sp.]MDS4013941.1 peptide-methionine (S)-S-oxide reductase MsrA [Accumulibacter sp.]